ncbi:sulfatase [Paludisphaera rhizosphaerae]|uniref:sulfatase n=1 Tax=Paludisphaera rhizosphaerae TaxID=2711216 RepID=UPI0013EE3C3A|nr:sulfatase [Paludisphaera rhizosphaerae]
MKRPSALVLASVLAFTASHHRANAEDHPNIVFILADDLGWNDTTINGESQFYETPNIQRLADRGIRFTNAYVANPLCSPTRASILTGLYPGRVGITAPNCHLPAVRLNPVSQPTAPPDQKALPQISATRLKTTYPSLAKTLKQAGYATGHFGKWHLGRPPYSALEQGFDVDLPHAPIPGPGPSYLGPWPFWPDKGAEGEHIEDRMAKEASAFIREHKDGPFFLNYWAFSVHSPWTPKPDLVKKYEAKAAKLPPGERRRNPIYAAMIESLDDAVGVLLETLDELKIADRTIIVFTGDNGGVNWLDLKWPQMFGLKTPPTSNAPLRGGKACLYEGGTREPTAVVWPGRIAPGTVTDAILSSVDWHPTLLEMAGLKPLEGQKLDGISQVSTLLGKGPVREVAYCFFPHFLGHGGGDPRFDLLACVPGTWVRKGDWKLIRFHHDNDDQTDRFELYNLKDDLGETRNLAADRPDLVKELDALIDRHLEDIGAIVPPRNPAYKPKGS